jgi:uncharacterized protein YggE
MADNRITVIGHAEHRVAPDGAAWQLTIEVTDPEARVAYDGCAAQARLVVERLKAAADVETQRISVEPAHEYDSGVMRQTGHTAQTIVTARVPFERAGEIADLAMESGATELRGPQLAIRARAAAELEALDQAVADARRRAERLAAAAGRALGPIMSIDTRDEDYFPQVEELRSSDSPPMPVEAADLRIRESVTVAFALGD